MLERCGPDHPTLCAGWTTYDLAAHLVLRERRADAAPGIVIRALAGRTATVQDQLKSRHSYAELVDLVCAGPPRFWPTALPVLDETVNTVEFFVHHEDVRRARPGWAPRELDAGMDELLWGRLRRGGRLFFSRARCGVTLRRVATGQAVTVHSGEPTVTLTGSPGELMMYAFNRKDHAQVDERGDGTAIAALRGTRLGV